MIKLMHRRVLHAAVTLHPFSAGAGDIGTREATREGTSRLPEPTQTLARQVFLLVALDMLLSNAHLQPICPKRSWRRKDLVATSFQDNSSSQATDRLVGFPAKDALPHTHTHRHSSDARGIRMWETLHETLEIYGSGYGSLMVL